MKKRKPEIEAFADPNGSGKTTITETEKQDKEIMDYVAEFCREHDEAMKKMAK